MSKITPVFKKKLLKKAFDDCLIRLEKKPRTTSAKTMAGFITHDDDPRLEGKRTGLQVFVQVYMYSDKVLAECPKSGGLLSIRDDLAKEKRSKARAKK